MSASAAPSASSSDRKSPPPLRAIPPASSRSSAARTASASGAPVQPVTPAIRTRSTRASLPRLERPGRVCEARSAMAQLVFGEQVAAQLEAFYGTRDVLRRRALAEAALDAQPGETVVDVGCGPGFYVLDLLERVGAEGSVVGIDPAPAMLAMASRRVEGRPGARLLEGTATSLPLPDASADRALAVQVFEYLPDVDAALAEFKRVLRPGGRIVL